MAKVKAKKKPKQLTAKQRKDRADRGWETRRLKALGNAVSAAVESNRPPIDMTETAKTVTSKLGERLMMAFDPGAHDRRAFINDMATDENLERIKGASSPEEAKEIIRIMVGAGLTHGRSLAISQQREYMDDVITNGFLAEIGAHSAAGGNTPDQVWVSAHYVVKAVSRTLMRLRAKIQRLENAEQGPQVAKAA